MYFISRRCLEIYLLKMKKKMNSFDDNKHKQTYIIVITFSQCVTQ